MNQTNKQDNSNFHEIKQNFSESVGACVEITLYKQSLTKNIEI